MKFIYAGRLEAIKGTPILFEAWKKFADPNSILIICGDGDLTTWSEMYMRENQLTNIKMLGHLPNMKVKKLIAESNALILPTQCYEGFPMTIIEAFSVGTPVIVGNIGNAGALVKEKCTGMKFIYNSADDLSRCLKEFCGLTAIKWKENIDEAYRLFTAENNYCQLKYIYSKCK